jgi:hypothetical protein
MHQDEEKSAQQKFIGDGIKILPDLCLLVEKARGQTIESITEPSRHEKAKSCDVMRLKNRNDKKRDEA